MRIDNSLVLNFGNFMWKPRIINTNERSSFNGSARSDGKEEQWESLPFLFLLPITPRASFGHASRDLSPARDSRIQIEKTGDESGRV